MRLDPHETAETRGAGLPIIGEASGQTSKEAKNEASNEALDRELDAELRAFEEAERERLGMRKDRRQWVDTMLAPEMRKTERETVTLLVSGLTAAQDFLIEAALRGVGYNVKSLPIPDQEAFQTGKEFGNRGQCNPTYFTVGNVVKFLIHQRDVVGLSTEDVLKKFIFVTAGACGPCRFGMYVTEYRKALRDAGFEGFRVMLFQQQGGLSQATGEDSGLEMNPAFFMGIIKAIAAGDVVNALGYRVRPYEIEAGATNRAIEASKKILYEALYLRKNVFLALYRCRKLFEEIKVDRLRARPKVAIIGEFWAMTTEGDGNYHLQKFLESEGAENDIQLTTAWLLYNVWEVARDTRVRAELRGQDGGRIGLQGMGEFDVSKKLGMLRLADRGLRVMFECFARPIGLRDFHLADMNEIADIAQPYYHNDLRGGEGHMEVGKLIYNVAHAKAHLTLSVKPFGCMPSSGVSDGVQSLVTARFPGSLYCAVETSGDGATNFYSRVQMYMFKARQAADAELAKTYVECGVTEAEVRAFLTTHPEYGSPMHAPPHSGACTAANLVREVAPLIKLSATDRAVSQGKAFFSRAVSLAKEAPLRTREATQVLSSKATWGRVEQDLSILKDLATGRLRTQLDPVLEKLGAGDLFGRRTEPSASPPA